LIRARNKNKKPRKMPKGTTKHQQGQPKNRKSLETRKTLKVKMPRRKNQKRATDKYCKPDHQRDQTKTINQK
jgi:hypothetical protein